MKSRVAWVLPECRLNPQSSVVGYSSIRIPNGYSMFAPVFKTIGQDYFLLTSLKPYSTNGVEITGDNIILIQKIEQDGRLGTIYMYKPNTVGGWVSEDDPTTKIADDEVKFAFGEGMSIKNNYSTTGKNPMPLPIDFHLSGEVDFYCMNYVPNGYSMSGNTTFETINIGSIKPYSTNGVEITGDNIILIQKIEQDGRLGTIYMYKKNTVGGWVSEDDPTTKIADDAVRFTSGEAFSIKNNYSTTGKNPEPLPILLSMPASYAK